MGYTGQKMKDYLRKYLPEWRERRRKEAILRLGGKCAKCGSCKRLDFDHVDPKTKVLAIGKMWQSSRARFETELAKCQLLCKECHIKKSRDEMPKAKHGAWTLGIKSGCACSPCSEYRDQFNEARRNKRKRNMPATGR